jgi:hydrogenase expression/formation protein HypC
MCLAIPGKLVEKREIDGVLTGKVKFGGISREACLDFLPEAEVGDYVLVHVGFAISRIDEEEARKTYEYLEKTGMVDEELAAMRDSAAVEVGRSEAKP